MLQVRECRIKLKKMLVCLKEVLLCTYCVAFCYMLELSVKFSHLIIIGLVDLVGD